jgi:hypothetical protein
MLSITVLLVEKLTMPFQAGRRVQFDELSLGSV